MKIETDNGRGHVLIVGGGLVGASLAIALDQLGCPVTLVEATAPRGDQVAPEHERNLALARSSVNGLRTLGVWPHCAAQATPIRQIHVSRAGEFGSARINASEQGVDALGWTLPASQLAAALQRRLDACANLQRLTPASLVGLVPNEQGWHATLATPDGERVFAASLLVGADGASSFVRAQLGIPVDEVDYQQTLFVCTLEAEHAHQGRAFERFADDGPVALLPLSGKRCGFVLTVPQAQAEAVAALDDASFVALAQQRFGWRLGRLSRPGRRSAHAIRGAVAQRLSGPRAVLVGNAAQTIHPIGAQGFNLGLRDALTLAELIAVTEDSGDAAMLAEYGRRRVPDRAGTLSMSHGLIRLACLPQPLLAPLRSLALLAYDRVPPLQTLLARHGMGFRGLPPRAVLETLA